MVFIGLGSNLGDRAANIDNALIMLEGLPDTSVTARSALYETEPRFVEEQPNFLNAAASLKTTLTPRGLLEAMLLIEHKIGRTRTEPNGPRIIDLDILLYDDLQLDEGDLHIPHPGLPHRAFVLVPLAEIAGDVVHPGLGETIEALVGRCPDVGWVRPAQTEGEA
ncbi:MAG: 2-amino-4-hydroxy-6-hydroxymethyldihydropteridine diphosphokinase [Bradymonadaceae bacterium]